MLASVVQLLVNSGYIGRDELSKLLLLSREHHNATLQDEVWLSLCMREFPNTVHIPTELRRARGHLWLYLQWTKHRSPELASPTLIQRLSQGLRHLHLFGRMPPPSCTANDIKLFVQVNDQNNKPVISFPIQGEQLQELLTSHKITCALQEPKVIGNPRWRGRAHDIMLSSFENGAPSDLRFPVQLTSSHETLLQVRFSTMIHLLRNTGDDCVMRCVLDENTVGNVSYFFPMIVTFSKQNGRVIPATEKHFNINCLSKPWGGYVEKQCSLRKTSLATGPRKTRSYQVNFEISSCKCALLPTGLVAITSLTMRVVQQDYEISGGSYSAYIAPFKEENGVTLLHILSEIE